MLAAKLDQY